MWCSSLVLLSLLLGSSLPQSPAHCWCFQNTSTDRAAIQIAVQWSCMYKGSKYPISPLHHHYYFSPALPSSKPQPPSSCKASSSIPLCPADKCLISSMNSRFFVHQGLQGYSTTGSHLNCTDSTEMALPFCLETIGQSAKNRTKGNMVSRNNFRRIHKSIKTFSNEKCTVMTPEDFKLPPKQKFIQKSLRLLCLSIPIWDW